MERLYIRRSMKRLYPMTNFVGFRKLHPTYLLLGCHIKIGVGFRKLHPTYLLLPVT